ncbi:MAG: amino acid permease [Planctomycetota bacterium]
MKGPGQLTLLDAICIGINLIIGSGIFLRPGAIAAVMGDSGFLAFAAVGVALISVALCYAEVASMYAQNGGSYVYAREAFGPWTGFVVGWSAYVSSLLSWAAVAGGATEYLAELSPFLAQPMVKRAIASLIILAFGFINYVGIKPAAWTTNGFTIAKLLPLLVFAIVGLSIIRLDRLSFATSASALGAGAFKALFACQGFENVPVPAGETKNPRRSIPLATVSSLLFSVSLYVLIMIVATCSVGSEALARSDRPLALAAENFLGSTGAKLIAICAAISMTGYNSGVALITPRYLSAMAADGFLPRPVSVNHPRFATPHLAIVFTTLAAMLCSLAFDYNSLVDWSIVTSGLMYLATCLAVPILRRTRPDLPRAFRLPGGWLVPAIGTAVVVTVISQAGRTEFIYSLWTVLAGLVVAAACRSFARGGTAGRIP